MPITFVGSAQGTNSMTPPLPHKIGDLFLAFVFRDGSATNPTIGSAGWTTITNTTDGTSCSISAAYKIATTTNEQFGTWTNGSRAICLVYRGQLQTSNPLGTFQANNGTTDPVNYPAVALANSNVIGSSWFVAFIGHRSTDTDLHTAPTGMTLIRNDGDATAEAACFDTNGPATANWPSTNVTVNGTASGWISMVVEIKANSHVFNNYQFIKAPNGISVAEKIR